MKKVICVIVARENIVIKNVLFLKNLFKDKKIKTFLFSQQFIESDFFDDFIKYDKPFIDSNDRIDFFSGKTVIVFQGQYSKMHYINVYDFLYRNNIKKCFVIYNDNKFVKYNLNLFQKSWFIKLAKKIYGFFY